MAKRKMPEKLLETPEVNTEDAVILGVDLATPKTVIGIVSGCNKLNIRQESSKTSGIKTEVSANTKLTIDLKKSNDEWYKVSTESGVTGFCMKKYVTVE